MKTVRHRKYRQVPNRTHTAKEYSNWTEQYSRGNLQQTRWYRKMDQWPGRQGSGNHPNRTAKRKKNF